MGGAQAVIYGVGKTAINLVADQMMGAVTTFVGEKISGLLEREVFAGHGTPESVKVISDALGNLAAEAVLGSARGVISNSTHYMSAVKTGAIHKNSRAYIGDTHVYVVRDPDGVPYKIGESAAGTRAADGASKRAEQQARRLNREVGPGHTTSILKEYENKDSDRTYETDIILRYRRMYGGDKLPGNKTDR